MADRLALLACGLFLGTAWASEGVPDEVPEEEATGDVDFIEYLGLWEESDDVWLMLAEEQETEEAPETEPEMEDES